MRCWNEACVDAELLLRDEIERDLAPILERYVMVEQGWCPDLAYHQTNQNLG